MKPNWDDAPKWARFTAQDSSGDWYWYEERPYVDIGYWAVEKRDSKWERVKHYRTTWKDSVQERPNV